jgi:hypothetical protein
MKLLPLVLCIGVLSLCPTFAQNSSPGPEAIPAKSMPSGNCFGESDLSGVTRPTGGGPRTGLTVGLNFGQVAYCGRVHRRKS